MFEFIEVIILLIIIILCLCVYLKGIDIND